MSMTLNDLVHAAILGGEDADEAGAADISPEVEKTASVNLPGLANDVEKVASALEFLGTRGVENLVKVSMHTAGLGSVGTNAGTKPGGNKSVDTSGTGHGDHHPALAGNEAAITFDKREKAKKVLPALKKVLDEKAFADPTLKENLSNASGKGDKNIQKSAQDLEAVKAELARRVAAAGGE
jgi:hypothetical protein